MRIGRWWICSARSGVPKDLPPWAENELVRRRMEGAAQHKVMLMLRSQLAVAQGNKHPLSALLDEDQS